MKKQLPYKEGTWFAVPLKKGGYAAGRVARHSPKGCVVLAYLFGPKREDVPSLDEVAHLRPDEAISVEMVGDLGLINGSWPIIGNSAHWNRGGWPVPVFIRRVDVLVKSAWRVQYSDDDPNVVLSEERIPYDPTLPNTDGLSGSGAVENWLTHVLSQ
jgi:hypothetical protein